MGFEHIVDSDYGAAASLGGLTYGTTTVEMASGFAAIENEGIHRTPTCIKMITDSKGNAVIDNTKNAVLSGGMTVQKSSRVYDRNAALMMTDCLETVMKSGTGRKLALKNITCAGKTGTTNDQKDGWFVGFTDYYTTAVWVGCDLPKKIDDLMGNTYPERIWHSYMEVIHEGLEDRGFEEYFDPREPEEEEEEEEDEFDGEQLISDEEGFFNSVGDSSIEGGFETEFFEGEGVTPGTGSETSSETSPDGTSETDGTDENPVSAGVGNEDENYGGTVWTDGNSSLTGTWDTGSLQTGQDTREEIEQADVSGESGYGEGGLWYDPAEYQDGITWVAGV